MLVLSRKAGESIVIDDQITVTVTAIDGQKVRIGISAPPHIRVDREEVHRRLNEFSALDERMQELVEVGADLTLGTLQVGPSATSRLR